MVSMTDEAIKPVYQTCLPNPRVVGITVNDRFYKHSHNRWVRAISSHIADYEHFILRFDYRQPIHMAVVVLTDGRCYVGERRFDHNEQYNRKRGFETAIGRALKLAAKNINDMFACDFTLDNELVGRELREACIDQLGIRENYLARAV